MTLTRRAFLRTAKPGAPMPSHAMITARGREALEGEFGAAEVGAIPPADMDVVRISSNENPLGPGPAAIQAIRDHMDQTNRYPMNARISDTDLRKRLAKVHDISHENVVIAPGSGEILRNCVRAFTSPNRPLVTAECSYESPTRTAEFFDVPIKAVPNDPETLGLDLDKMAGAALGAGLVFLCNPNNPTGTAHSRSAVESFVRFVAKESPFTYILIDEAYHEYVTAPSYQTSVDLAMKYRNVLVGRTFSKAYGMAGLRQGYAVATAGTAKKIRDYKLTFGANVLGAAAILGTLDDPAHLEQEVARNTAVRKFTMDFFRSNGYWVSDSQTNFIFAKTNMHAKDFREACAKHNVQVGRDFPPYEKAYSRISIGTMDEMKRATEVFREVLGISATDAGAGSN